MLRLMDVIHPSTDERVEAVFRHERSGLIGSLVLATLCIGLPFFFLFPLTRSGTWGVGGLVLLLALGVGIGLRALLLWDVNVLIVTNQRLIHVSQTGFWHRRVQELAITSVQEIVCESSGVWQTILRIGTLRVRASGAAQELVVERLSHPERARTMIQELSSPHKPLSTPVAEASELRHVVHGLIDRATPSSLETVKALLEKR